MKPIDIITFIISGFAMHKTSRITSKMHGDWQTLTNYVVGVEGTYPFFVILLKRLKVPNDVILLASAAYHLAFLMIGLGVAGGRLVDSLIKKEK